MTIEQLYSIFLQHPFVQTDTRRLKQGELFFALKGPAFNGNEFASQALASGAAYAVVDEVPAVTDSRFIIVEDVLTTLQQLALYHRRQFTIPVIAITGSNGKTTTKELVHAVLSTTFKTYTTKGNLNNHIGIPLTLLAIQQDAEMAVIEMGANHLKEIESYCRFTLPTHGIITNCGKAHLEGFGSLEGVQKAKGELFDHLRSHDGTAFVMWDYDYLQRMSKGIASVIKYGTHDDTDITGHVLHSEPFLSVTITKGARLPEIQTNLVGSYNLPNILTAVATGKHFNVPDKDIQEAIGNYVPSNSRSQLIEKDSNKIILDAYNANPTSMKAAIENLAGLQAQHKILILGSMAELGQESLQEHQEIIDLIGKHSWTAVLLVGGDFLKLEHPYKKMNSSEEAAEWFRRQQYRDAYLLIKGSRSMKMEKVLE